MIRETRGFPDFCRSKDAYDIMNPIGFILEVPAELRMRRSRRKKEDIMNSDEFILEVPAELRMRRKQRKKMI